MEAPPKTEGEDWEAQKPIFGEDWNAYFRSKYGDENVTWEIKLSRTINRDNKDLLEHLTDGHGIGRKGNPSIKGAHDINGFYNAIDTEATKYEISRSDYITDMTPHPRIEGIYEITYRLPALELDRVNGTHKLKLDFEGKLTFKKVKLPKTVYAPPITTDDILKWGREAVEANEKAGKTMQKGVNEGIAKNGLKFEWRIVDEEINSIYPIFD